MPAHELEDEKLRSEILNLFQYIQRMRTEIAQMNARDDERTHFETVSEHLDAIVASTGFITPAIVTRSAIA